MKLDAESESDELAFGGTELPHLEGRGPDKLPWVSAPRGEVEKPRIPDYFLKEYYWAYLNPRNVRFLDQEFVVSLILWGNHRVLQRAAFAEVQPGMRVLQSACVYGDFSPALARHVGPDGQLDVIDIAPIQVDLCSKKLRDYPHATVRLADASRASGMPYDAVCCYFLLHELPADYKRAVVNAMLESVAPGGKVIFVDYHKPHWAHPLRSITGFIFDRLEKHAKELWDMEIADFASASDGFVWSKQTFFGKLYQKVVAHKPEGS